MPSLRPLLAPALVVGLFVLAAACGALGGRARSGLRRSRRSGRTAGRAHAAAGAVPGEGDAGEPRDGAAEDAGDAAPPTPHVSGADGRLRGAARRLREGSGSAPSTAAPTR